MKRKLFNKKMNQLREARKEGNKEEVKKLLAELNKIKKYI